MAVANVIDTSVEAPGATITLAGVVEHLAGVLDVLTAPLGVDVAVGNPTIHDVAEPDRIEEHDVVLAVGLRPEQAAMADLVRSAAAAGACAVVVKTAARVPDELAETSRSCGVALVGVPPEITWSQVHSLLRTAIASSGAGTDASSAPIGDLFALANAVAAMVGGATTIEDTRSRVLAYSSDGGEIDEPRRQTILGRQVPNEWVELLTEKGCFKQLWSSGDVVHLDDLAGDGSLRPRMAIAVRAGDELLGSIWVAQTTTPFDTRAEQALREAAELAALHIVRSRAGEDLERQVRGEQLRAILEGRGPLEVLASRLGADVEGSFVVCAFELRSAGDAAVVAQRERALDFVSMYCEAFRRRAASVAIGHTIYTLVPLDADRSTVGVFRMARELIDRAAESLKLVLRAGVGSVVDGLRDVTRSRADADQVLRVLGRTGDGARVAGIGDVRSEAMLLELGDLVRDRPHLLIGEIERVIAHDDKHGSDYAPTLLAYFDAFGDVPLAAKALEVHPNTLRYRLRRITEFAGIDLADPQQRLAAELQLRLR